ncbi:MAG TPA: KH domain-containing protein [Candidatus Saccharimonadia bacterium]|nr:KH domain-containing protein [Candidatus Saccharimonadia bacterium]
MSDIDQQFIEYVVKSLVGKPEAVKVERRIDEKGVLLELTVDPEDLGRVIGKRGATAQSLRTLLRALGTKNDARYNLKIIDNGNGAPSHSDNPRPVSRQDDTKADADDDQAVVSDEEPANEPEPADEPPEELPKKTSDEGASDRLAQTRQELADLDDLDV